MSIVLIAIAILVILFTMSGIRIVQQSETVIIERLGKYSRTLTAGINIIIPIVDKPRSAMWRYTREGYDGRSYILKRSVNKIDLRETVYDFPKQNVITKDNVVTEINAILYFQVIDPVKAVYEISNLPDAIEKLTQTTLRNVIGDMNLDETLTSRDTINSKLRSVLDDASHKWGVKVNRVELQDINPPHDIRDAMEKQMRAERDKRAKILTAEAEKQSKILDSEGLKEAAINKAEGEKQSKILRAEGEAEARIRVARGEAEAISLITNAIQVKGNPVNYLVAIRYIDTLKDMVSGKDNKMIYMPYEATGVLSSIGGIKDMLDLNK
ncbi:MAG: SPFH/Band 7/PHB domain protein [Bacteroidales bacterium]|jgi:regulator of protease activity HflC (stomatin/prohibitin superfamily)|nr:SPFH/Band 7/PHB domain protein [Bacteroidales bacterium]